MLKVIYDKRLPMKIKRKVFGAVMKTASIYNLGTVPVEKSNEKKIEVAEMGMLLRWMSGVKKGRIEFGTRS